MSDNIRTAFIAGTASVVVAVIGGFITYQTTQSQVSSQIEAASLTHAKDIAAAVHDSLSDLLARNDPGRVRTTLVGLYFLGATADERKQIIETAGSAETPDIRAAISYVLSVDRKYGHTIATDPDVLGIVIRQSIVRRGVPTPPPMVERELNVAKESGDQLDQTISLLNGRGWVYLGLGPDKGAVTVDHDQSIAPGESVTPGAVVKFAKTITFRGAPPSSSGFGPSIGTIKTGETAVLIHSQSYPFRAGVRAVWGEVFLCAAPTDVARPPEAAACPTSPPAISRQ